MKFSSNRTLANLALKLSAFLCLALMASVSSAQVAGKDGWVKSWIEGIGEDLQQDYTRYSIEDVEAAKVRLQHINAELQHLNDEWAGVYVIDYPEGVGDTMYEQLRWSPQSGFINYYIYTCTPNLRYLNFGVATPAETVITLTPEYPENSTRQREQAIPYVKVKWGQRHYLIPEDKLDLFCDSVAGLSIRDETEGIAIHNFWVKHNDVRKPIAALPVLPAGYKRFLKYPIETVITEVGTSWIEKEYSTGQAWYSAASLTPVTLRGGALAGIKPDMIFRLLKTGEEVRIKSVTAQTSLGIIIRDAKVIGDETDQDSRTDDDNHAPKIKVGWRLTTQPERNDY